MRTTSLPCELDTTQCSHSFCTKLPNLAGPHCIAAISYIAPLLLHAHESTLVLVVEAIDAALTTGGQDLDAEDAATVFATLLDVWQNNATGSSRPFSASSSMTCLGRTDPTVTTSVSDLLATYASTRTPVAQQTLATVILPALASLLAATDTENLIVAPAISALDSIMSEQSALLAEGLFASFAGPLFALLEVTDDQAVIQVRLWRSLQP